MPDHDEYVRDFVDFAVAQGLAPGLTFDDAMQVKTRDELGISSLNVILLIANYMKERGNSDQAFRPEWVARLNDVDGIVSVMHDIDQSCLERVAAEQ